MTCIFTSPERTALLAFSAGGILFVAPFGFFIIYFFRVDEGANFSTCLDDECFFHTFLTKCSGLQCLHAGYIIFEGFMVTGTRSGSGNGIGKLSNFRFYRTIWLSLMVCIYSMDDIRMKMKIKSDIATDHIMSACDIGVD